MIQIELAPEVIDDFERVIQHLVEYGVDQPGERIDTIIAAIDLLATSPEIGRPCRKNLRELVIGHGSRGYVALYQYLEDIETVFVLAVRSQREAGYSRAAE